MKKRKCKFPGCITRLSEYNSHPDFCFHHQTLLEQNDVKYRRYRNKINFYQGRKKLTEKELKELKKLPFLSTEPLLE